MDEAEQRKLNLQALRVHRWPDGHTMIVEFEVTTARPIRTQVTIEITGRDSRPVVSAVRRVRFRKHDVIQFPFQRAGASDMAGECAITISAGDTVLARQSCTVQPDASGAGSAASWSSDPSRGV
jgi:hypothetical protein